MQRPITKHYLKPYDRAVQRHGAGFASLLWASPDSQAARFAALASLYDFSGKTVLDGGCGRADLLDWLIRRGTAPSNYIGIEAMAPLAASARQKEAPDVTIIDGDFVANPRLLNARAQAVIFCGSLNTLDERAFRDSLHAGYDAATDVLLFNFLSSPHLAAQPWLHWYDIASVESFARSLSPTIKTLEGYMYGDCTMAIWKSPQL